MAVVAFDPRWIVNPEGLADKVPTQNLIETKQMQADNAAVFEENAKRVERLIKNEIPPLPLPSSAEVALHQEEEKYPMEEEKDNSTLLDQ